MSVMMLFLFLWKTEGSLIFFNCMQEKEVNCYETYA